MRNTRVQQRKATASARKQDARIQKRMQQLDDTARLLYPLVKTWGAKVSLTQETRRERKSL